MRTLLTGLLMILGVYLVCRAAAEPFTIDSDYRTDWGGPSVVGVLAVHMLPGVLSLVALTWSARRRWSRRRAGVEPGAVRPSE